MKHGTLKEPFRRLFENAQDQGLWPFQGRGEAAPRPYKGETGPFPGGAGLWPGIYAGGMPAVPGINPRSAS